MVVELRTQSYWETSLAWHRIEGFYEGHTVCSLFEKLRPAENFTHLSDGRLSALHRQATDLGEQIVRNKLSRKKHRRKNVVALPIRTKISGQQEEAA